MASQMNSLGSDEWPARALRPKRAAALRQYRRRAPVYDMELMIAASLRRRTIARLGLKGGETVLDVGCGTGLSLPILAEHIVPGGRIIGIEQSPEMINQARQRVRRYGWRNMVLLHSPVEEADIRVKADAALFCFTHDIMRTPAALDNVFRHLRPGARVVASGLKWAPPWAMPANVMVFFSALASVTALEGLREPWSLLADRTTQLEVEELFAGTQYIATGLVRPLEQ